MTRPHLFMFSITLFAAISSILSSSYMLDFIVLGAPVSTGPVSCETKFGYRVCCENMVDIENPGPAEYFKRCTTCWSDGNGGWHSCDVKDTPTSNNAPPFTPKYPGDIYSTPGPAAQDKPTSESSEGPILMGKYYVEDQSQTGNTEPKQGTYVEGLDFANTEPNQSQSFANTEPNQSQSENQGSNGGIFGNWYYENKELMKSQSEDTEPKQGTFAEDLDSTETSQNNDTDSQ